MNRWLYIAVVLAAGVSCTRQKSPEIVTTVQRLEDLDEAVGRRVIVHGEAKDSKLSAVVVCQGFDVSLPQMDRWPDAVRDKQVVVEGNVEIEDFGEPEPTPGREVAGPAGKQYQLNEIDWHVAGDEQ